MMQHIILADETDKILLGKYITHWQRMHNPIPSYNHKGFPLHRAGVTVDGAQTFDAKANLKKVH
jgi:hypothetical protein